MAENEKARTSRTQAEVYDEFFVPALFQQWGSVVAKLAGVEPNQCVLDVACGTGGRLALAVCDALDHSPGYTAFAELLRRLFGDRVADAFNAPFVLGDPQLLLSLCTDSGIFNAKIMRHEGMVRFASIQSLVSTERACVWTLGGILDDAQFEQLLEASEKALRPFLTADGTLAFAMPVLIVTAAKACAELRE